ncbi:MAG: biopolymer transporter ExbD [Planctomycetota bacterium]
MSSRASSSRTPRSPIGSDTSKVSSAARVAKESVWSIRTQNGQILHEVSKREVAELLYRRQLSAQDWATASGTDQECQIGDHDVFFDIVQQNVAAKRQRRRDSEEDAMDMTPMIDVVFLLLIFFMITATFHLQTGMQFPPTKDDQESSEDRPAPGLSEMDDRILIEISASDEFSIDSDGTGTNVVGSEQLPESIREASSGRNLSRVLVVANELASLEAVVRAFDAASIAGIGDVALADLRSSPIAAPNGPIQFSEP